MFILYYPNFGPKFNNYLSISMLVSRQRLPFGKYAEN